MLQWPGSGGGKWLKVCPKVRVWGETGCHIRKSWKISVMPAISTLPVLSALHEERVNPMTYAVCSHQHFLSICSCFFFAFLLFLFLSLTNLLSYPPLLPCLECAPVSLVKYVFCFSLQMIDTGCSGRLTCCQDTHSPYTSMDKEFLRTASIQQSGGSPMDTRTFSPETGLLLS